CATGMDGKWRFDKRFKRVGGFIGRRWGRAKKTHFVIMTRFWAKVNPPREKTAVRASRRQGYKSGTTAAAG
ncbi:MAG: hypothetical protein RSK76_10825, partial [Clostridia bacterium]